MHADMQTLHFEVNYEIYVDPRILEEVRVDETRIQGSPSLCTAHLALSQL